MRACVEKRRRRILWKKLHALVNFDFALDRGGKSFFEYRSKNEIREQRRSA
jgi:hypothetical protein